MTSPTIRLHSKLYRVNAIDEAMSIAMNSVEGCKLQRKRDGAHHLVVLDGLEDDEARDLLAEIGDLALELTLRHEKK